MTSQSSVNRPAPLLISRLQLSSSQERVEAPQQRLLGMCPPTSSPEATQSLPFELIYHIMELATPPPRLRSFRDRYEFLQRCSLVDKQWRGIAQELLFRHIYLNSAKLYELLQGVLLAENSRDLGATALGDGTEEIRLGEDEQWTVAQVKSLLHCFPNVRRIWMMSKNGLRGPSLRGDSLSLLPSE